jgi:SPP1 gp7 family putative phage head morphogenesis protein
VAGQIGQLIEVFDPLQRPEELPALQAMLDRYAQTITPWAQAVVQRMQAEVDTRDARMWAEHAQAMGLALRQELHSAPTGEAMRALLRQQVERITSLPREAGQRVHALTLQGLENSVRSKEIAAQIRQSGQVSASRATLIARTEVARTATVLTQTRAQHIGSTHYIWRTSGDGDVRPGHRAMSGNVCEWAHPPAVNEGTGKHARIMHHHPGQVWNCCCYPEPILPE